MVRGGFVVKQLAFAVPGDLAIPTGGYAYDRRMIAELDRLGWQVDLIDLGEGFPWPDQTTLTSARTRLLTAPAGRSIVIDGLALGVMPETASRLAGRNPLVALVHHPLALELGLSACQADALRASEMAALASVQRVVVTSAATARLIASDYGVPAERITVATPGSDPARPVQGSQHDVVRLLSVGAVVPRKGYDILIAALATLTALSWTLMIVGDRTRDPNAVARLDADIARHALGDRITVVGAVSPERLAALYSEADVFVLASYFEGYGMAFAEAIAHGLPIIGTTGGAIPETVPPDTGLLVPAGDISAFARALRRVIGEDELRRQMANASRRAAARLPTWRQSAEIFARALETLR
jgi:glycosyltransferase involved in cell wall biosynthesis